jgi:endonuclease III
VVHEGRARDVLKLLSAATDQGTGLVAEQADLVENQVPPGITRGSLEHSIFLFLIVPNDRGVKSSSLWGRSKEAFGSCPELFDFNWVVKSFSKDRGSLASLVADKIRPRYVNHSAAAWIENSARLLSDFGGDPRALFSVSADAREVARVIRSYKGFGPKTGGMMLRAAVGLKWSSAEYLEEVEIPVDVHDVRISIQTGILSVSDRQDLDSASKAYAALAPIVRRVLTQVCAEEKLAWPNIDRALWLIGSRGCVRRRCTECPLTNVCSASELRLI